MDIIVCLKQVPDTNEVRINHETGTLIREGVPSIINPDDKNGLEEALRIRDEKGGKVTVLCMGPPQAKEALREAIAMGADKGILLSDRAFAGSDTWATATILAAGIRAIGKFDIIFCGRQAIDGDTAQVGPEIAEFLDIPQISYAEKVEIIEDKVRVKRKLEDGHFIIESKLPVLITSIKELNTPRYPRVKRIFEVFKNEALIEEWTINNIEVDTTQIGVKNSPTNVYKSFVPKKEFNGIKIEGSPKETVVKLVEELKKIHIV